MKKLKKLLNQFWNIVSNYRNDSETKLYLDLEMKKTTNLEEKKYLRKLFR